MKDTFRRGPGQGRASREDEIKRLQAKIGELEEQIVQILGNHLL